MPRYVYIQRCEIYIYRIPIPFINELDTKALPPLHYTTKRICYPGVNINTNNEHMICCDCTDNCQDKTKCACCLLTAEVSRYKDFYGYVVVIIVLAPNYNPHPLQKRCTTFHATLSLFRHLGVTQNKCIYEVTECEYKGVTVLQVF